MLMCTCIVCNIGVYPYVMCSCLDVVWAASVSNEKYVFSHRHKILGNLTVNIFIRSLPILLFIISETSMQYSKSIEQIENSHEGKNF